MLMLLAAGKTAVNSQSDVPFPQSFHVADRYLEVSAGSIREGQLIKSRYTSAPPMRVMTVILRDCTSTFFTYERDFEIHEATFDNRWVFHLLEATAPITDPDAVAALRQIELAEYTRQKVQQDRDRQMMQDWEDADDAFFGMNAAEIKHGHSYEEEF